MTPPIDKELAGDSRWTLVARIVQSRHFEKAAQLRDLLLYLTRKAITSPSEGVTEQEIGAQVLGRRPDYDPQADNIVRVQIRHLRQKLDTYFLTDGQHEPVVISIPKGSHVVRFEPVQPNPVEAPVEPRAPRSRAWRLQAIMLAIAIALLAFVVGRFSADRSSAPGAGQNEFSSSPLWTRVFPKDQQTTIVIADVNAVIVQNVLQRSLTLSEYIDRFYLELIESAPEPGLRAALRMVANRQYTSLADATLSGEFRAMGMQMGARVAVRFARHMHVRDFNSGNFILIGSRHSIPWVELFEPNLNFHFERIGKEQRFGFRNRQPLKGESEAYVRAASLTGPQESFATVSLLPNLAHNGTVLLLTGVTMETTEAAGHFAMSNDFSPVLTRILGTSSGRKLPFFEILLKSASMAGAPYKVDVVAWRQPPV